MKRNASAIFFLILLFVSQARSEEKDKPYKFELAPGITVFKGNTDRVGITGSMDMEWITKMNELVLLVNHAYAETEKVKDANQGDATFTYDFNFLERESLFVFLMPSYNEFQKLDLRLQSGGGYKHTFVKNDIAKISMSAAALYEREDLADDLGDSNIMRFSFRPKLKFMFGAENSISIIYFYQPRADRWEDYRMLLDTSVEFQIYKKLFFELKLLDEYNEIVPEGVKRNDVTLINSIKLKL